MSVYDIDYDNWPESKNISDERVLFKMRLNAKILKIIHKMETSDVLTATGLDKSDLSRMRCMMLERFSIDRLIGILEKLGYTTSVLVKKRVG